MRPAFSVIFLTTLIGVGQGLFLALFTGQYYSAFELLPVQNTTTFYGLGSGLALLFLAGGLLASFFHLGHPERAWRSATRWRTSWLAREVIALPTTLGLVFIYAVMHYMHWDKAIFTTPTGVPINLSLVIGGLGAIMAFTLFLCTGMIYACIKFLQEWASPLTVINYTLLGMASGFTLATTFAHAQAPALTDFYGLWAIGITLAACLTRTAALWRNAHIKYISSLQTAIGVRHSIVVQRAQGQMGGSFNTRDFFHHKTTAFLKSVKWIFLTLVFPLPIVLLWLGMQDKSGVVLLTAFIIQYAGLIAERWFFFAQAKHPQNLYYQTL